MFGQGFRNRMTISISGIYTFGSSQGANYQYAIFIYPFTDYISSYLASYVLTTPAQHLFLAS